MSLCDLNMLRLIKMINADEWVIALLLTTHLHST